MFRFALQPLLDRRKLAHEAAHVRAAAAEQGFMQAARACEDLERRLRGDAPVAGEPQAIALLLERQQRVAAAAAETCSQARRELASASSALCVLESLRARAYAAYRDAQSRREEAETEESNALRRAGGAFGN